MHRPLRQRSQQGEFYSRHLVFEDSTTQEFSLMDVFDCVQKAARGWNRDLIMGNKCNLVTKVNSDPYAYDHVLVVCSVSYVIVNTLHAIFKLRFHWCTVEAIKRYISAQQFNRCRLNIKAQTRLRAMLWNWHSAESNRNKKERQGSESHDLEINGLNTAWGS